MATSNIKALIPSDLRKVWDFVLDIGNYGTWRSDLSKTETINEKQFIEYTNDGYPTTFTVTLVEPYRRWEFNMENSNMQGHWTGIFSYRDGTTVVKFTENVTAKKLIMKPFIGSYLKKQQSKYIQDLKNALELNG